MAAADPFFHLGKGDTRPSRVSPSVFPYRQPAVLFLPAAVFI